MDRMQGIDEDLRARQWQAVRDQARAELGDHRGFVLAISPALLIHAAMSANCASSIFWPHCTRAQSLQIESIEAPTFWWSMVFSENRLPLFRIMLQAKAGREPYLKSRAESFQVFWSW
jgi:hypothetical protein